MVPGQDEINTRSVQGCPIVILYLEMYQYDFLPIKIFKKKSNETIPIEPRLIQNKHLLRRYNYIVCQLKGKRQSQTISITKQPMRTQRWTQFDLLFSYESIRLFRQNQTLYKWKIDSSEIILFFILNAILITVLKNFYELILDKVVYKVIASIINMTLLTLLRGSWLIWLLWSMVQDNRNTTIVLLTSVFWLIY